MLKKFTITNDILCISFNEKDITFILNHYMILYDIKRNLMWKTSNVTNIIEEFTVGNTNFHQNEDIPFKLTFFAFKLIIVH